MIDESLMTKGKCLKSLPPVESYGRVIFYKFTGNRKIYLFKFAGNRENAILNLRGNKKRLIFAIYTAFIVMEKRVFKRKIYDRILQWKQESNGDTALMIQGARRIGKSTISEEFARNEYSSYLIIDFKDRKSVV